MTDEEKTEEYVENILCTNFDNDGTSLFTEDEIKKAVLFGLAEGRKEKELSYEVEEVTKVELNKCNTIEDKMEWLGKVLGQAIFKNDMNYAVWVNVQKNNIIEQLEKENEELKDYVEKLSEQHADEWQKQQEVITELKAQIEKMKPYCKCLCKNYSKFSAMSNDCVNGVCRNCNKWELLE